MKHWTLGIGVVTVLACAGGTAFGGATPSVSLQDTTQYSAGPYGSWYALLHVDDRFVDTVDVVFGAAITRGGVLYFPVHGHGSDTIMVPSGDSLVPRIDTYHGFGDLTLFDGRRRSTVADRVPHFNSYFSSPVVLDSILYYWGIRGSPGGPYDFLAMRHDFAGVTDSVVLRTGAYLETDNPGHFRKPRFESSSIVFEMYGATWWVDWEFGWIVRADTSRSGRPGAYQSHAAVRRSGPHCFRPSSPPCFSLSRRVIRKGSDAQGVRRHSTVVLR